MGVAGLFKDLLAYSSDVVVLDHRGRRTFRFDASWIIHQVVNAHYYEVIVLGDWTGYRKDVTALLMLIKKRYGAGKVSFCFDGLRLPGKLRNTVKTPFALEITRLFRKYQPYSCVARAHNNAAKTRVQSTQPSPVTRVTRATRATPAMRQAAHAAKLDLEPYGALHTKYMDGIGSDRDCRKLVHQESIAAAGHTKAVMDELELKATMAITEVDATLPYDQINGDRDSNVIVMRDTDPIVQQTGCLHLFTAAHLRSGHMQHYRKSNLHGGVAGFPIPGHGDTVLSDIVEGHGFHAVQVYSYIQNNDYNKDRLPGIGGTRAAEAVMVCCTANPGWDASHASRTALLRNIATHLCAANKALLGPGCG